MPPTDRYQTLDAWRGLACLMVVVHHAGFAVNGGDVGSGWLRWSIVGFVRQMDLGVPLFFVVSGYCIAASAVGHRRRGHSTYSFMSRRFVRIYPPYWAALAGFAGFAALLDASGLRRLRDGAFALQLDGPRDLSISQWIGNIALAETWRPLVVRPEARLLTRVAWSLCYEEQFYLVVGVILLVSGRRFTRVMIACTLMIVAARIVARDVGWLARMSGTFVILWHEFAVGMAVYWVINVAVDRNGRKIGVAAIISLLMVAGIAEYRESAVAAGFGLLLIALKPADWRTFAAIGLRPLISLGRRSYSIYLAHLPATVVINNGLAEWGVRDFWARAFITIPISTIASLGVGWIFYDLVERWTVRTRSLSPSPALSPVGNGPGPTGP